MTGIAVRGGESTQRPRRAATRRVFLALLCLAFCAFSALGVWQLYRLQWKLDLIERVESRIHAEPVSLPPVANWAQVSRENDEYKRVRLQGHFVVGHDTRVQALTVLGAGFWVLSPFQLHDGNIVLVNRGYVPSREKGELLPSSAMAVTGLLRLSEPGGGFLRDNVPSDNRWYSRDVGAIGRARGLANTAPFFVDADRDADAAQGDNAEQWPRGGLTVTRFSNNHLGYALTWFALALLVVWATHVVRRTESSKRLLKNIDV
jgi:surfeit locus 1 family protein